MNINKLSLRTRIFIAMIFIVVIASLLIAAVTIYQYNEQAEEYHKNRLERKEEAIKSAIIYELGRDTIFGFETYVLPDILDRKLNEISDIHNLDVNIYDLDGNLLRSSYVTNVTDTTDANLSKNIMRQLVINDDHRLVFQKTSPDGKKFKSSLSYLIGYMDEQVGIIGVPYLQDNTFQDKELKEFLGRLSVVYLLILFIAIIMAYFLSEYITKSLENVSRRMRQTTMEKKNERIILDDASQEIMSLVDSYNNMIDQLEDSAVKLAESERKQAWREMARQVAHEIKNPLTPMRLTIQSFDHNFDPEDPNIIEKMHEYSDTLIQQIDIMSSIASAFSSFAQMPNPNKEKLNIVEEVKKSLDIFHEPYIEYHPAKQEIVTKMDKIQLTRIMTNLVTNAIHALKNTENPKIEIRVSENEDDVLIEVEDNGQGIGEKDAMKIFEPKFTTKSSGMGLGLPMVKNIVEAYNGSIGFVSGMNKNTIFLVKLPKEKLNE
jgi:signal transduction histidine kinase